MPRRCSFTLLSAPLADVGREQTENLIAQVRLIGFLALAGVLELKQHCDEAVLSHPPKPCDFGAQPLPIRVRRIRNQSLKSLLFGG